MKGKRAACNLPDLEVYMQSKQQRKTTPATNCKAIFQLASVAYSTDFISMGF
jgi:hypothetical protein